MAQTGQFRNPLAFLAKLADAAIGNGVATAKSPFSCRNAAISRLRAPLPASAMILRRLLCRSVVDFF
jgi:hypothetical protein